MNTIITTIMICLNAAAVDGDTLKCEGGTRWRLIGVAAPEMRERYGPESKATLARMVDGQNLACIPSDANGDRIVGNCVLLGPDVGGEMVRSGLARSCPAYDARYVDVDSNPLEIPRAAYCEVKP